MRKLLKEYWWILLVLVILPALLNLCYFIPALNEILEEPKKWTAFWGTYLSAIASFVMALSTWKTLGQNSEQLNEIRRQWNEQNKPKVFCSLEKDNLDILLVIYNASNSVATNVCISIVNKNVKENPIFLRYAKLLENTLFSITPLQRKVINLYLAAYVEEDYSKQFIDVKVQIGDIVQGTYRLYLQEINLIKKISEE